VPVPTIDAWTATNPAGDLEAELDQLRAVESRLLRTTLQDTCTSGTLHCTSTVCCY
jgi:hypothetical protein